jgi:hypothetical protein
VRGKNCPAAYALVLCASVAIAASAAFARTPKTVPGACPAAAAPVLQGGGGNLLFRTPNDVHRLILDEGSVVSPTGFSSKGCVAMQQVATLDGSIPACVYTSRAIETEFDFNDLIASWNVDVPKGSGFWVSFRVGRKAGDFWTPWYYLGSVGAVPGVAVDCKTLTDENGVVNQDYFQSCNRFDRIQYRFHMLGGERFPTIKRVGLAYSNTLDDADIAAKFRKVVDPGPKEKWARRLPIRGRSQNWESDQLRGLICSPTSLSMVLEYYGIKRTTVQVCDAVYDAEYHMYGNWWRNVQSAYTLGMPGYLERFGDWNAVKRHISRGEPVIASIRIAKGDLRNFPNRSSDGHLIVIAGFDADGNVQVNDPAGRTQEKILSTYAREDAEKIWLNHGGVGYVLTRNPR